MCDHGKERFASSVNRDVEAWGLAVRVLAGLSDCKVGVA